MLTWQNTGDPCAPETVTFVNHLMPTRIGFTTALGPTTFADSNPAITNIIGDDFPVCYSYFNASGDQEMLMTMVGKIYRYPGNADVSRAAAYTGLRFSFAQWRDRVYACNGADKLQKATTGNFADVAGTVPKFTRIAVAGEFLAGIGLVADFVGTSRTVTASPYLLMISAVGNPDQFDVDVDTTAYYQDIYDTGGPLTAIARLRDFFVVFQKSGVYVVENIGGVDKWAMRSVSSYFGCEFPDSVIEVKNVLYWISPTNGGEVVAFDGSQITVLSSALKSLWVADSSNGYRPGKFKSPSATTATLGNGLTAATDGETILWNRAYVSNSAGSGNGSVQLYMNIPTSRFGLSYYVYSGIPFVLASGEMPYAVCSNAWQDAVLCIHGLGGDLFGNSSIVAGMMSPAVNAKSRIEMYRSSPSQAVNVKNFSLLFSEYVAETSESEMIESALSQSLTVAARPAIYDTTTPSLKWSSSKRVGEAISAPDAPLAFPTAAWNSNTNSFDFASSQYRSVSSNTFAFSVFVSPINSLTGVLIDAAPAGVPQTGAKAVKWQ